MIRIRILNAKARRVLAKLPEAWGRKLYASLGGRLEYLVRRHFIQRNQEPNAKGWRKSNFWSREGARNTALENVTSSSATVSIASAAIAHKVRGGVIRPKRGRALAIPVTQRAYIAGSPREGGWAAGELFLVKPKSGNPFLATRSGDAIEPQYWLVPSVTQRADKRALPPRRDVNDALQKDAQEFIDRTVKELTA